MATVNFQPAPAQQIVIVRKRKRLPDFFLRPDGIVMITLFLSALAWSLPDTGIRTGFNYREPITIVGVLVLAGWYGLIVAMAALGFRIGRLIPRGLPAKSSLNLSQHGTYRVLSCVAWVGVATAYLHILDMIGVGGVIVAFSRNTVNDLKTALYTDYSIGFYSLRYTAALAGGIALYRFLDGKGIGFLDLLNGLALVLTSTISSRLTLVWAVMIALSVWITAGKQSLRSARYRVATLGLIVITLLWVLNYSRNAHYYAGRGTESVVMAGVAEVRAYLGAPFQVALGVANNVRSALSGVKSEYYVDWEANLNTNSAIDQLLPEMGWWALVYIGSTALFYGALAGYLSKLRGTYVFLGYPVILYAFGEIWRVDLFRQGIFYTNLIGATVVPLIVYLFTPQKIRVQTFLSSAPPEPNS